MTGLLESADALYQSFDCALLDLDGVVYRGAHAVEHAAASIARVREHGMATMFVTNNAARTPGAVADHLTDLGVPTGPEEVTTAAMAAAALIAAGADEETRVLAIGGPGLHQALIDEELTLVDSAAQAPTVVVQGFAPELTWSDLAEAAYAVTAGAQYVASNLDLSLPTERGLAPGNGALVGAVIAATGVQPRSTGKPQPDIFQQAARSAGARHPLIIGDRLDTDLAGARAARIPGLHVCTGVDGPTQVLQAEATQRPSFLAADLRGLIEPHPLPHQDDGWWICGRAGARISHDTVLLRRAGAELELGTETTEISIDELRAAATACWSASDAAGTSSILAPGFPQVRVTDADHEV